MKKPLRVWFGVDPKGRVIPYSSSPTKKQCWYEVLWSLPAEVLNTRMARKLGFTVRRFRLEEDE